jgi:hypothetical protein
MKLPSMYGSGNHVVKEGLLGNPVESGGDKNNCKG